MSMLLIMMLSGLLISAAPHHIIPTKGLFTMYKAGDFGIVKWVILVTKKLWELVMCASKQVLVAL